MLASISTPCSVKANGSDPPKCFLEGIAFCDTSLTKKISGNIFLSPVRIQLMYKFAPLMHKYT
jgi:hypothetical protein